MSEASTDEVKSIVGEVANLQYEGDIQAIAVAIVKSNGDLRTLLAYRPKTKIPLLAATVVLLDDVKKEMKPISDTNEGAKPS